METGLSRSVGGVREAFEANARRAERISKAKMEDDTFTKDMAELPSDDKAVKANTSVIRTQDEMLGTLMDLFG